MIIIALGILAFILLVFGLFVVGLVVKLCAVIIRDTFLHKPPPNLTPIGAASELDLNLFKDATRLKIAMCYIISLGISVGVFVGKSLPTINTVLFYIASAALMLVLTHVKLKLKTVFILDVIGTITFAVMIGRAFSA